MIEIIFLEEVKHVARNENVFVNVNHHIRNFILGFQNA